MAAILDIDALSVRYGTNLALRDVSVNIQPGSVVGVIGPNGSGKSTLINAVAGTVPHQHGAIRYGGRPLRRQTTRVAYVPQAERVNWGFPVRAKDVVLMGRYRAIGWLRQPSTPDRLAVEQALARLGLDHLADRHISQLSGGQQQRIFLARTLVQDPEIVLLDEPLTGIDVANRAILHQILREFSAQGRLVLMASHDLDQVREVCDTLLCLNRRLIAFGPTATTFTPGTLRATFGGQVAVFA